MDIQARIAKILSGPRQGLFESSVVSSPNRLDNVTVQGSPKGEKKLFSPIKQCQFAVSCSTSPNNILILKDFDIPALGLSFSMEEDKLWFPVPKPSVPTASMTGYLWGKSLEDTLVQASLSQYRMGLLSTRKGIGFTFYLLDWIEDSITELDNIGLAAAAVQTVISGLAHVPSLGFAAAVPDIVKDTKIQAEKLRWNTEYENGVAVTSILTLKGCRLSPPVISQSQSSGEFSTVKVDLSYTKAVWLDSNTQFIAPAADTAKVPVDKKA